VQTLLRLAKFRQRISQLGADGAIVTDRENVAYLTGFSGSAGTLVIGPGRAYLLTDGRYEIRAKALAKGYKVTLGKSLADVVNELPGRPTLIYEQGHLTDGRLSELRSGVRRASLVPEGRVLQEIRAMKDPGEIELLERAVLIGDEAWSRLQPSIVPGVTEVELANQLEATMKELGAAGVAFDTIVASGPNSAIPHHETGERKLQEGDFVTFDFGALYKGYNSDMTRTVFLGQPTEKHREVYNAVYRAQVESAAMIAPGVSGEDVSDKAREIIKEAGYDKNFTHGLGHGVGRNVHELPGVGKGTVFEPGHVVTVEPGIYIEGWGGVRIEDCVLVTPSGSRALTTSPKPEWPTAPGG
jgi:Xaa-Pro aminopeptidase